MKTALALCFFVAGLAFASIGRQMFKEKYDGTAAYCMTLIFIVLSIAVMVVET